MIERDEIKSALAAVHDPCSVQANAPLSLVDMGLVTAIELEEAGSVRISLRPTSPWCTLIGSLMQAIEDQVRLVSGVTDVTIEIDRESSWSEGDLTEEGRRILHDARARARAAFPVRPRQWQRRADATE